MLADTISRYSGAAAGDVSRWLTLSPEAIYEDPAYLDLINGLDKEFLQETVITAREAYREGLDDLAKKIEVKYDVENPVMSAFTLGNWLVGFLYSPTTLPDLLERHGRVPAEAIREGLPELLGMLESMPTGRQEWQQALALLSIPLVTEG